MVVRKHLRLPGGYSARQIDAVWCLFDPRGVPLLWSADATTVEIHAWRDVWRRRHEDFNNELVGLRAGARLPDMCGRRESSGMSHDIAEGRPEPTRRPGRIEPVRWRVFAIAAAGAAAGLVIGLAGVARLLESPAPLPPPNQQAASIPATLPKPLGTVLEHAGGPEIVRAFGAAGVPAPKARAALRLHRVARPRLKAQYAVSVGNYVNPTAADRMKHLVRSKGYIVDVVPHGAVSQVVTRPYRTRAQAERVARGLETIRFPAQLIARRAM